MSVAQEQQLCELWHKAVLVYGKKMQDNSKKLEARAAVLEAKTDNSTNEGLFTDKKSKNSTRNNLVLDRKGIDFMQNQRSSSQLGALRED